ncbi:MAG: taurine ABC transporter substrate-binding protein, partial [Ardenticatenaceae bacterium]
ADAAGMTVEDSNAVLDLFTFPSNQEQLSDAWMGGTVQTFIKEVADFFVEQGELEESLDSYDGFINTSFLEKVK